MQAALKGIRVIDLTQTLAGPSATMLLGDFGADVIKIEPAGRGDMLRQWGPPFIDDTGSYFLMFNRNKRSLTLNLKDPEGLDILYRLVREADVVVESFRPDVKKKLKIDYETLSADNPGLIYASLSGFGQTGPYAGRAGFDPIAQGMSGLMSITGTEAGGPTKTGAPIGDYLAGLLTAFGIVTALNHRHNTGRGQYVDTSLLQSLVPLLGMFAAKFLTTGERPGPQGNDHPMQAPYGAFRTADGWINIAAGNQPMWERLARLLELEGLIKDERFLTVADRVANRSALTGLIEARLTGETSAHWQQALDGSGVAAGPILHVDEVFEDPQVLHLGLLKQIEPSPFGPLKTTGFSVNLHDSPAGITQPPPKMGQHNGEILAELGYDGSAVGNLKTRGVI